MTTPHADLTAALQARLGGEVRGDALGRALYATDASMYRVVPLAVAVPRDDADVQAALEEAARFGVPVTARGGGSSLAGSAVGTGLVLDHSRHMGRILAVDAEARTATVEPGVVLDALNAHLAPMGLRVGPDPASASRATVGGMVGTNATGTRSIRYGSVVDHVQRVRARLADGGELGLGPMDAAAWAAQARAAGAAGEAWRRLDALLRVHDATIRADTPRHWRRAGGYRLERLLPNGAAGPLPDLGPGARWSRTAPGERNAAQILCGSEGTLAVATEITLGLVDAPAHTALGVLHFESRRAALLAVEAALEVGPSAVELFDRVALRRARDVAEYAPRLGFVQGDPGALLIVEVEGESPAACGHELDRLARAVGAGVPMTRAAGEQMEDVWAVRKAGLGLAMSARMPVEALAFVEDAAVPVGKLPGYIADLEAVLEDEGTDAVVYAHASAGCLHVRPFLDLRAPGEPEKMERIARASARLAAEAGGLVASEHGDGRARSWLARDVFGEPLTAAYQALKRAFDPEGRMNPGVVVGGRPMTADLRAAQPRARLDAGIAFPDAQGIDVGFGAAVEACNGQGVCRKRGAGAMCPSYMATGRERDSTRGRANALREALAGGIDRLTGPEVQEAMDLCLSCKACAAECPAGVNMAALKTAWLDERWKAERPPLRVTLLANLPKAARATAGPLAPAANRLAASAPARAARARLGLDPDRPLPPFARRPFRTAEAQDADPTVVLYADTFARTMEPEIARAAVRVMRAAGERVAVSPDVCCGRTYLSEGLLDPARRLARALVDALAPLAERGLPLVGLEPSCVLTLRDEVPRLLPGDPRAQAVARQATTFDAWSASRADALAAACGAAEGADGGAAGRRALVHVHCHQKALAGRDPSRAGLAAAGYACADSGAGCCGLAGGFGYEAHHAEVSRAVAEDRLAPAVRAAPDALVVASGTSCRHQVAFVTGREAVHPAVALAAALDAPAPAA